jgi:hypothetical protein
MLFALMTLLAELVAQSSPDQRIELIKLIQDTLIEIIDAPQPKH